MREEEKLDIEIKTRQEEAEANIKAHQAKAQYWITKAQNNREITGSLATLGNETMILRSQMNTMKESQERLAQEMKKISENWELVKQHSEWIEQNLQHIMQQSNPHPPAMPTRCSTSQ